MPLYDVEMELTGTLHLQIDASSVEEAEAKTFTQARASLCYACSQDKDLEVGGLIEVRLAEQGES